LTPKYFTGYNLRTRYENSDKERALLAAIEAEIARQQGAAPPPDFGTGAPEDVPF